MKRPQPAHPRRPATLSRRTPRTRKVAAVELARVEYERARLEAEMSEYCARAETAMRALEKVEARSRGLTKYLADEPNSEGTPT